MSADDPVKPSHRGPPPVALSASAAPAPDAADPSHSHVRPHLRLPSLTLAALDVVTGAVVPGHPAVPAVISPLSLGQPIVASYFDAQAAAPAAGSAPGSARTSPSPAVRSLASFRVRRPALYAQYLDQRRRVELLESAFPLGVLADAASHHSHQPGPPRAPSQASRPAAMAPSGSAPFVPPLGFPQLPRSVSADAARAPGSEQIIDRLFRHTLRITEMWEADRKHHEASRCRVEELYREQWLLMEQDRARWEAERAGLRGEVRRLRARLTELEERFHAATQGSASAPSSANYPATVASVLSNGQFHTASSMLQQAQQSQQAESRARSSVSQAASRGTAPACPPVRTDRTVPAEPQPSLVAFRMPSSDATPPPPVRAPQTSYVNYTFIPHNPAAGTPQDTSAARDSQDSKQPASTVDIGEINPALEGVSIKTTAIKPTFTDAFVSPRGSRLPSLPEAGPAPQLHEPHSKALESARPAVASPSRVSSEQTMRMLAADESSRLRMHAGHTPSHSRSYLDRGAIAAIVQGALAQPPATGGDAAADRPAADPAPVESPVLSAAEPDTAELAAAQRGGDASLVKPLMLRNMPAHDERFLGELDKKLEVLAESSAAGRAREDAERAGRATRTAIDMAHALFTGADAVLAAPADANDCLALGGTGVAGAGLASAENVHGEGRSGSRTQSRPETDDEADIPLKLKQSSNFGRPFGSY